MRKRVLLVGHQGYVGPLVVAALKEADYEVIGLDTGYYKDNLYFGEAEEPAETIKGDLRDVDLSCLKSAYAVVHLAGLSNDPLGALNQSLTEEINTAASKRLVDAAKQAGVERFVFASSCSVYGAATQFDTPLDEQAPCHPVSAYAVSKMAVEAYMKTAAADHFAPVALRFATAYGLSPRLRLDIVLNNLVASAFLTKQITVLSDGTPWRPLVHVQDMALAVLAALHAPRDAIHAQSFNIGRNDANYQVRDIAETVARVIPGATLDITGANGGDPRSYRVDFSKAHRLLPEFKPSWTLERGARELYEAFNQHGLPADALKSAQFIRLKQLQTLIDGGRIDSDLRWN